MEKENVSIKKMKGLVMVLFLGLLFLFSACKSNKVQNSGELIVENGKGEEVTITYDCIGCEELILDSKVFDEIIREAGKRTKNRLNYPLSFIPIRLELLVVEEDSLFDYDTNEKIENTLHLIASYDYIAKNGYGNELEGEALIDFHLKDYQVVDLKDEIKLEDLKYEDGYLNRSLFVASQLDDSYMTIHPRKDNSLIVVSSISCVDKNVQLTIVLENDDKIRLYSWNDFNCDGTSYFRPFNSEQINKLQNNNIKTILLIDKRNSASGMVAKNETDYFKQFINLKKD